MARTCNLILIVLDAGKPMTHKRIIEKELEGFGIRLNQQPPQIILKRKEKGGLAITKAVPLTKIDNKMITAICKEYKISNGRESRAGACTRRAQCTASNCARAMPVPDTV